MPRQQLGLIVTGRQLIQLKPFSIHQILSYVSLICVGVVLGAEAGLPLALPRIPAGVFVAFFVPGYAALLALNGASRVGKFTLIQHLVLSIPLSFSFAVIVGVLLNDTPLGVRPLPSILITCAVSLLLLFVAWWRARASRSVTARPAKELAVGTRRRALNAVEQVLLSVLVGALAVSLLWAGYGIVLASRDIVPPFTELYITQVPVVTGDDTPTEGSITVALNNHEARQMSYELRLLVHTSGVSNIVAQEQQIIVEVGSTWEQTFALQIKCRDLVEAQLWLQGQQESYRKVQAHPACLSP
jgi:uncharacterized membrane protein